MKSIDLTAIIQAIITLMSTVITIYILPKVKSYLAAKLSNEQRENLKQWVRVGVAAAEQIYNKKGVGEQKKEYVISFLRSKGLEVDYKEIEALVESEVYKLSQGSALFVAVPGVTEPTDLSEPATVLDEPCGVENLLNEDTEPDTADETDNLFSARNTCE